MYKSRSHESDFILKSCSSDLIRMAPELKSKEVEFPVPGGVIAGQEWKQTAKPTRNVLLLPGRQDGSNSFKKLIPLLPAEWWMIAIEFPGDGLSTRKPPGSAYHSTDRLMDLKRVVKGSCQYYRPFECLEICKILFNLLSYSFNFFRHSVLLF